MADGSGSTAWEYDSQGHVIKETKLVTITGSITGTFLTQWGYTKEGLLNTMQYPDSETLTYGYLPQGALSSISSSLGDSLVTSSAYDASGRLKLRWLGGADKLQNAYTYFDWSTVNGAGRLKRITAGYNTSSTSLLDLRYYSGTDTPKYDPVGNLLYIYDYKMGSPQTQEFTYDEMDRLETAQAGGGTDGNYSLETTTYDSDTGSLESKTGLGDYTYLDSAHAHAVTHLNGVQKYWYDQNGNQTRRITAEGDFYLTYDAENRLVSVLKIPPGEIEGDYIAQFTYDGDGRRVKQVQLTTTTVFIGEYYQKTGSTVTKYYSAGAQQVAVRSPVGVRYVFADHLGSTTVTADVYGGNVQRQLYKGWGETRSTSTVGTDYAYTGQYAYDDSSTEFGLLFYRSRFYDSSLGRFVSADTVIPEANQGVQAWDRYAGMNNNPVRWNDPSGHDVGNAGHDGWKTVCQVPMTCEQEPVDYEPSPVNHNYTSETNSDLLDGGPGSVGGAQAAEEGYTGYSNSGESTNPAVAGALALPAFANDMLVLFRDSVRTGNEISGRVYWDLNPNGFKLTGVSITNSGYEDVAISNASVTEYSVFDNSLVNYEVLYSINQTLYTPPNYGVASPGSSPALVTVSYENVPNYHYLNISIGVISVSGRTGSVGLSLYVNPPLP